MTHTHSTRRAAAVALAAALTVARTSAQQPTLTLPPTIPTSAQTDSRPVVALTLDDAVKFALDRNLTIAVQRLNPLSFDPAIESLYATYRPTITSVAGAQSNVNPPTTSIVGVPPGANGVTQGTTNVSAGVSQNVQWGGGQFSASLNSVRSTSTSTTVLYNPTYSPAFTAQYTQPLLRGRTIDPNRQQLIVTRLARDVSDIQLRSTIVNTLSNVREAYWNFVYAVQAVEIAQQQANLAGQLVKDNETRLSVGVMAELDVVTAQAQEAQALQTLVQARGTRDTAELALKQLIVSGTQDPNWNARLDPTDRPDFEPVDVDVDGAIHNALQQRTDMLQARKNVEANQVTYRFLENQLLPQADVTARYGLAGLGGTEFNRAGSAINSPILSTIPGGIGNALGSLADASYPNWSVQLNFSVPVGRNVATASMAAAKIQMTQATAQVRQIELQVATDVTNAAIAIRNGAQAAQAAEASQELAQKSYEAEQEKFKVGLSTNYNVILALNTLSAAKNTYLQAVLGYRNALVEFDRLGQTTLTSLNITMLSGAAWANGAAATGNLTGSPVGSAR